MSQVPLKLGHKCSEQGPTTHHFHWQNPARYTTEITVSLLDPGNWLCNGATQNNPPARSPPTTQASRVLLFREIAKGCQLVVCLRYGNCLQVPYRNPQTTAQGWLMEHDQLLPWLPTQVSIHQFVASGYSFPWLLMLHPCDRSRNSTAQSHGFQILSICRPHFLHTGSCSLLPLTFFDLMKQSTSHQMEN